MTIIDPKEELAKSHFIDMIKKSYELKGEELSKEKLENILIQYNYSKLKENKFNSDFLIIACSNTMDGGIIYSKHKDKNIYLVYAYNLMSGYSSDAIIGIVREVNDYNGYNNYEFSLERYIIPHSTHGYPSKISYGEDDNHNKIVIKEYKKYDSRELYWNIPIKKIEDSKGNIIDNIYVSTSNNQLEKETSYYLPKTFINEPIIDNELIEFLIEFKETLKEKATSKTFEFIRDQINAPLFYKEWNSNNFNEFSHYMYNARNILKNL